jgi:putative SOS response-associated peptidase YedK
MCGRFSLVVPERFFSRIYVFKDLPEMQPDYNIPPGVDIWAVRTQANSHEPEAVRLKWGLVPFWAKDPKIGNRLINARSETVAEKPAFRAAFQKRRCIIPSDGFFEWKRQGKSRIPHYIHLKGHEPFAMAGLWESWSSPGGGTIESCTILTTSPNSLMERLHDRMPVILPQQAIEIWLDETASAKKLTELTYPYPSTQMEAYPVSSLVNNPLNNSPDCLLRHNPPKQEELF